MVYKFRRYYRIEIDMGTRDAPIVTGFISELEIGQDEILKLQSGHQDERVTDGQTEDIAAIKSTITEFFGATDMAIMEVNMQEYEKLFDAQVTSEAHLPTEMRGEVFEKLM